LYTITEKQRRDVAFGVNVDPTVVGGLNLQFWQRRKRSAVIMLEIIASELCKSVSGYTKWLRKITAINFKSLTEKCPQIVFNYSHLQCIRTAFLVQLVIRLLAA